MYNMQVCKGNVCQCGAIICIRQDYIFHGIFGTLRSFSFEAKVHYTLYTTIRKMENHRGVTCWRFLTYRLE